MSDSETNFDHRLWPGKAQPDENSQYSWHPTTFHSLDVAACAQALLLANPNWLVRLAKGCDVPEESLGRLFVQLIAMHDIGKLSEKFCRDIGRPMALASTDNTVSSRRHWQISFYLLFRELDERVAQLILVRRKSARRALYAAVSGHHGRSATLDQPFNRDIAGVPVALSFVDDLNRIMPAITPVNLEAATTQRLSWSLAGLTVAADWLGSRQEWFPYASPDTTVENYWADAQKQAKKAIKEAGLSGSQPAVYTKPTSMVGVANIRPMQAAALSIPFGSEGEPMLCVLEDTTGSGKTEAALLLAHRMMTHGLGEGLYVALPTMATANAMYTRLSKQYRYLFAETDTPSIALAHGKRKHNDRFREAVKFSRKRTLKQHGIEPFMMDGENEDKPVAASCDEWIADDRRKAFLGEVGIGTIDQAFLAVLPVKFSALRLFGLSQRILVVDEAHACDPYMHKVLERTLQMHAAMGGSAIVMTATLTKSLRESFVNAFRSGLGVSDDVALKSVYPAITTAHANAQACLSKKVVPLESQTRSVSVSRLADSKSASEQLIKSASQGACCVWIRNTVDGVVEGAQLLWEKLSLLGIDDIRVDIFHARFALQDRLEIEKRVVGRFGKTGSAEDRRGCILVASQVIEASLDLDFDVMVSDIAPIDSLIQRAGRLWRHMELQPSRNRHGTSLKLHVVSPDPIETSANVWAGGELAGAAYIYGAPTLWRTAQALFSAGQIDSPHGLPALLEQVAGDDAPEPPEALSRHEADMLADTYAAQSLARFNLVNVEEGYEKAGGFSADQSYPTRIGLPSVRVVLLREDESNKAQYWAATDIDGSLSEVSITKRRYEKLLPLMPDPTPSMASLVEQWPEWKQRECPLLMVKADGGIVEGVSYCARTGLLFSP